MELHAEDLAALLDALGIERAHIGGTSYGAELSMVFALKYPERTRRLLVTSAVSELDPVLYGLAGLWAYAAQTHDPELLFRAVYPLIFSAPWIAANQAVLDQARERYNALDMDGFLELMHCFMQLDITGNLRQIEVPTLVAVGEVDLLKPPRYSEIIARELPNAELVIIPNAGHAAMWERPAIFNTLILDFLAG